jgi:class 3 adenylate cyclase
VLRPLASALRAVVCAQHLQKAVSPAGAFTLDSGQRFPLSLQVALLAGPVRRLLVGDPAVYQLDLLAGAALDRVLATEALAAPGEIVLDQQTAQLIDSRVQRLIWRIDPASANRYALVPLWATANVPPAPLTVPRLGLPQVRPLLLPFVAQPLKVGLSEPPAEVRHVTLLGLRFSGMDYDGNAGATALLDGLVRKLQQLLHPYGGVLLQLAASTKATSTLMAFGMPNATATDGERAVRAAQELLALPQQLPWMRGLQLGVHQGLAYTGGCGSGERRSYGVFGEAVHGTERLVQASSPGTLLASLPVAQHTSSVFVWESAASLPQKGKAAAMAALRLVGLREAAQPLEERSLEV